MHADPVKVRRLIVLNFRNYPKADVKFGGGWNLFFGDNGAGKTNFLEAVALSVSGAVFKGSSRSAIMHGKTEAELSVIFDGGITRKTVVGEEAGRKVSEQAGNAEEIPRLVVFLPQEESQIDSTAGRRRLISRGLFLRSKKYAAVFSEYAAALKQRNKLLFIGKVTGMLDSDHAAVLGDYMASRALAIWEERDAFTRYLSENIADCASELGGIGTELGVALRKGGFEDESEKISLASVKELYARSLAADIRKGTTAVGPHRDNFVLSDGRGRDATETLSRGQKRTLLLSLHLLEGSAAESEKGKGTVFLLDDVFSELDKKHRSRIIARISESQVLCTSADPSVAKIMPGEALRFKVAAGTIN